MTNIKPTPPIETQELLKLLGFYSEGFCVGHCEHAPLREINPELNSAIELWHDTYYSSPTHDNHVDISDYLTGEPVADWRATAIDLANAIQSYDPESWVFEGEADLVQLLMKQLQWFGDSLIPAVNRFHSVHQLYTDNQSTIVDPF